MNYTTVDTEGRVLRYGTAPLLSILEFTNADERSMVTEVVVKEDHYFSGTDFVLKETMLNTVSSLNVAVEEIVSFTALPDNVQVWVNEVLQGSDSDGNVDISFDTTGEFIIRFEVFPYLDKEYTINVN